MAKKIEVKEESKLKKAVVLFINMSKEYFKRFWTFATAKPNLKENAFQYLFRQFILTDSAGNPSWTVTSLVFVLALIGCTMYAEYQLALSPVMTYSPEGHILTWQLKGFSSEFYYLLLSLSVVITGLFNSRQKRNSAGTTTSIIDKAKDVITKIKTKI